MITVSSKAWSYWEGSAPAAPISFFQLPSFIISFEVLDSLRFLSLSDILWHKLVWHSLLLLQDLYILKLSQLCCVENLLCALMLSGSLLMSVCIDISSHIHFFLWACDLYHLPFSCLFNWGFGRKLLVNSFPFFRHPFLRLSQFCVIFLSYLSIPHCLLYSICWTKKWESLSSVCLWMLIIYADTLHKSFLLKSYLLTLVMRIFSCCEVGFHSSSQ